jgi:dTDP-4-amino-4,6-dideoxygalactose transaminase
MGHEAESDHVGTSSGKGYCRAMTIPVHRPRLPIVERLLPYLRRIDETRWYTNSGPLVGEFEERLAAHFSVPPSAVAAQANGTLALTVGLRALDAVLGSRCLVPSWTFAASAAAVLAAGLVPYFVDVDRTSWALDPNSVLSQAGAAGNIGVVMVVSPFGVPIDRTAWDRFNEATGIAVLIDAAAGFDAIATGSAMRPGHTPIMVSLHATKSFGIGEGGLLISTDSEFMLRVRRLANFGFEPDRRIAFPGINGKLSEYAAAVGLAALDEWPQTRRQWSNRTAAYAHRLRNVPGIALTPGYGQGWVSSYCNVEVQSGAMGMADQLARSGIETRHWWGPGCHAQPAYRDFARAALPVTEMLADTVLGLPSSVDISDAEIDRVVEALQARDGLTS